MHVNVRIEPRWTFQEVRRAAVAFSRAVERRAPNLATSKWWKEERHGVFLDYNQNAKDRTTCSAYSVRPLPDARVSTPLHWNEVPNCDPADFTIFTVPERFAKIGDPHADMNSAPGSLEKLLELAAKDDAGRRTLAAAFPQNGSGRTASRALAGEVCPEEATGENAAGCGGELPGQSSRPGRA
jgi:DNA primase